MSNVMLIIKAQVLFSLVPVCAFENLALNKPTWQAHPWPNKDNDYGSENAVDGMYTDRSYKGGQCTINADNYYTAEWRVDLGNVLQISHIRIFYRTFNQNPGPFVNRMAGFSLYISNITSKDSGHLCYKDETRGSPSVNQTINCSIYGRYVIYYNERSPSNNPDYLSPYAYNELCEVEVYGYSGNSGDCCQNPCPQNCLCDAFTGICEGCIRGYYGQFCTSECPPGQYGNDCSNQCSLNCNVTKKCDKFTGQCEGGCKPGYTGNTCVHMCPSGYFGQECRQQCSINCYVTGRCNKVTGQCEGGCKSGWRGSMCDQMCGSGYYGKNCSSQCSTNCDMVSSCDNVTGECYRGCKPGWTGIHCDQECSTGNYGIDCRERCSNKCNETLRCDKITGECDGGCKPGWTGINCNKNLQESVMEDVNQDGQGSHVMMLVQNRSMEQIVPINVAQIVSTLRVIT